MDNKEFLDLVWRLDEIMMHRDHLNQQIGKCGGQCKGLDGEEGEGLCPVCSEIFTKVQEEDERLFRDMEVNEILIKLKQVYDDDKTGEYQRILDRSREGEVNH